MGLPDWDGDGEKTILMISGIMCLGFIPFYIIRSLHQHGWKRCRVFFEKRGWLKPLETEEEKIGKQHQAPVAPKPLQSAIPAVLKKIERAYKAPAHITANDHPLDWQSPNQDPEAGWDPIRRHHQPSNRDSGGSWDPVRSHHAVSLVHPVPPTPPNTRTYNSARSSWTSGGSSVRGVNPTTTPPNGAAGQNGGGPSHSHDKRASISSVSSLRELVIPEHLIQEPSQIHDKRTSIGSVSTLKGLVIPKHLIKEGTNLDDGGSDSTPYLMSAHIKTKITDGNYNHVARRNAMDHGKGTGTGVWLEVERPEGPVGESSSESSPSPPPKESVPKIKETFPVLLVPSQAVSIPSFTPSPTP